MLNVFRQLQRSLAPFRDKETVLIAFGARGRLAPAAAAPRTSTQSCRESMPVPSQIDFTSYAYASEQQNLLCHRHHHGHLFPEHYV